MRFRPILALIVAGSLCGGGAIGHELPRGNAQQQQGRPGVAAQDQSSLEQRQMQKEESEADVSGNPSTAPFKWAGRLVYVATKAGDSFSCSAQFIGPRVLLTAGHCVYDIDKNAYYSPQNLAFILQYQNGTGTHVYHAKCAATLAGYSYPKNYASISDADKRDAFLTASQWDYGMILVDADSITGSFTSQTDWKGKWRGATRIGYPAEILGTEIIQRVHGLIFFADDIPIFDKSYPGLVVHWQDNSRFTSGSSGGAWIAQIDSAEAQRNNIVIGLNSFHIVKGFSSAVSALPGAEFGPYFRSADYNALYKWVANGCK